MRQCVSNNISYKLLDTFWLLSGSDALISVYKTMEMQKEQPPPYSPPGVNPPPAGFKANVPYQPPLQPMDPPHPQPQTHILIQPHIIALGPNPQDITCPSCHVRICTNVKTEPNSKTHLFALLLCLFQCYLCCCIPYCVDSCQSQNHYCPNCGCYIGSFQN